MSMRLPGRLFVSYVLVIAVGAVFAFVTVRLLAPRFFSREIGVVFNNFVPVTASSLRARRLLRVNARHAFESALTTALLFGTLASVVAAVIAAAIVTRRLVRPLNAVRSATRLIAAGRYEASVPVPRDPELAGIASDVNTLATRLADTETRRSRLLGEVAHEMRTPLTALEGYVEGLIDGVFAPEPEILSAASDELRRLRRLADDLSALSRAEEQRLDLTPADTDLAQLARKAADRLAPQFSDSGVTLTVEAGPPLPVRADPDRITQVLTNILGNALTATPAGGSVTVQTRAHGREAQVAVTDTGVGLAAADLERVFERFYRAPDQLRRAPGSGIGLTIARNIARAHGGEVTAASPGPGSGATFFLTLPARSG
ncbi:MAG TPA: HAMP domain-containing sensor histidine kinase [Trebonia sp.]